MSDGCMGCGEEWNPGVLDDTDGLCPHCWAWIKEVRKISLEKTAYDITELYTVEQMADFKENNDTAEGFVDWQIRKYDLQTTEAW